MNEKFEWTFGSGHVVVVGDVFDRGAYVTECLWLLYELERQALEKGGRLHYLLGNHEHMSLSGDYRYLAKIYKKVSSTLDIEYRDLFSEDTELGKWIRSKNTIEKIGEIIFVHSGISPALDDGNLSIFKINEIVRENLGTERNSVLISGFPANLVFGSDGPLWFRGYTENKVSDQEFNGIMEKLEAQYMVSGHNHVDKILPLFDKRMFLIDAKYGNNDLSPALWIKKGEFFMTDASGIKKSF